MTAPPEVLTDFLDDGETASPKICPMCGAKNGPRALSCTSCGEPLTTGRVWQDGRELVMTKGAELPYRCLRTNAKADSLLKLTLHWHPAWVYVLIISPLIYIIVALILQQKAVVELPLSRAVRRRRFYALLCAWLFGLGMFPVMFLGIALADPRYAGDAGVLIGFGGFSLSLIALFVSLRAATIVTPKKIDREFVRLKGVHPDYLVALPPWPA